MKQIFEWLREQIDKYSYDTETCGGRYIDIIEEKKAIDIINEAEAKWENDCCEWKYNETEDFWESSCEHLHIFMADGPVENMHEFCPYCGKKIKVVE